MGRGSIDAELISHCSAPDACAFADKVLGKPSSWASPLISFRLRDASQADWKCEVGRWLLFAEKNGLLDVLVDQINMRVRSAPGAVLPNGKPDPNDRPHSILHQVIAPLRVAYYLCANGWSFVEIPTATAGFDVDLRMRTPSGVVADIQLKSSDQLGRIEGHRRVDGESDEHVTLALAKAIRQIAPAPGPIRMVVTCPLRDWPMSRRSGAVAAQMVGSTKGYSAGRVTLDPQDRGLFSKVDGAKVHAAIILDFFRPLDGGRYGCTIFMNPWVDGGQRLSADQFPHSAVCELVSERFRWTGSPGHCHVIPDGTLYLGN